MNNPIYLSKKTKKPFVYYHTRTVQEDNLSKAIEQKKSIELDIALDEEGIFYNKGEFYIGHPVTFYTVSGYEFHDNIALEKAVDILQENKNIFVVLDCKNIKALTIMGELVKKFGHHRCLFHAYASEWSVDPTNSEIKYEEQWKDEGIPLEKIAEFKKKNKIPVIAACMAVTEKRIKDNNLVNKMLNDVAGMNIDCLSLYMQDTDLPPLQLARKISEAGYFNWINIDKITNQKMKGITYIGMTDNLENASVPNYS